LTKSAETIIAGYSGASLHKHIAELEVEKSMLHHAVDNGTEDYNLLMADNASLLAERNNFCNHCEDVEKELAGVHSDAKKRIADLEAKVKSTEAHCVDVATAGKRQLRDFEGRLVRCLEELC
jgi:chromosome segregation ATPase